MDTITTVEQARSTGAVIAERLWIARTHGSTEVSVVTTELERAMVEAFYRRWDELEREDASTKVAYSFGVGVAGDAPVGRVIDFTCSPSLRARSQN